MKKNSFEIDDVIGNVIGNWLYDEIVQQGKKEKEILNTLEKIEKILVNLEKTTHTLQQHFSKNQAMTNPESDI